MTGDSEETHQPVNADDVFDTLADLFLYAPVGLALQVNRVLPTLIESGRRRLDTPLGAAKVIGKLAVDQQRHTLAEKLRQATEPYFGPARRSTQGPTPEPATTHGAEDGTPSEQGGPSQGVPVTESPRSTTADRPESRRRDQFDAGLLAVPGYDILAASQVLEHLDGLGPAELDAIAAYESAGKRRLTILTRIEALRSEQE